MTRFIIHYGIHFIVPFLISYLFFKDAFFKVSIILLLGIYIDLDHLIATPIFDSNRCSINFHPLHSYFAISLYLIFVIIKKTRLIGLALCLHIIADLIDCYLLSLESY